MNSEPTTAGPNISEGKVAIVSDETSTTDATGEPIESGTDSGYAGLLGFVLGLYNEYKDFFSFVNSLSLFDSRKPKYIIIFLILDFFFLCYLWEYEMMINPRAPPVDENLF